MEDLRQYYDILGVSPDASLNEIKAAYKKLLAKWDPPLYDYDLQLRQMAVEKTHELDIAYEELIRRVSPSRKQKPQDELEEYSEMTVVSPHASLEEMKDAFKQESEDGLRQCYETLGVSPDASLDQIKVAYKKLLAQWDPPLYDYDLQLRQEAVEKTYELDRAYERLTLRVPEPAPPPEVHPKEDMPYMYLTLAFVGCALLLAFRLVKTASRISSLMVGATAAAIGAGIGCLVVMGINALNLQKQTKSTIGWSAAVVGLLLSSLLPIVPVQKYAHTSASPVVPGQIEARPAVSSGSASHDWVLINEYTSEGELLPTAVYVDSSSIYHPSHGIARVWARWVDSRGTTLALVVVDCSQELGMLIGFAATEEDMSRPTLNNTRFNRWERINTDYWGKKYKEVICR